MRMRDIAMLCLGMAVAGAAFAQAPPPPAFAAPNLTEKGVRDLAANCAICHGTQGRAGPGATVPGLAGRGDVADVLRAFRDGKREATLMHQIAKGYSDAEIDAIGGYFARQRP